MSTLFIYFRMRKSGLACHLLLKRLQPKYQEKDLTVMKSGFVKLFVCVAASIGLTASVHAGAVTGTLDFLAAGSVSTSAGGTTVSFLNPAGAIGLSGDYAGLWSTSVSLASFSYTGSGNSAVLTGGPVTPEWIFTIGSKTYSFDLTSLLSATATPASGLSPASFAISGLGTANITGEQSSEASWTLSGTGPSLSFTFDVATTTATAGVPDGGTTAILLGAAFSALALVRRKLT